MADSDITVEILKDIRDESRGVRGEVRELHVDTNQRFDARYASFEPGMDPA